MRNRFKKFWSKYKCEVQSRIFPTLIPHFTILFMVVCKKWEVIKNAGIPFVSRVPALVPGTRIELVQLLGHRILSPACLPVPPPGRKSEKVICYQLQVIRFLLVVV